MQSLGWRQATRTDANRSRSCGYVKLCFWRLDDDGRHLLERADLLHASQRLGPHIGNVLCEQGMHQTYEFASREDEGAFVLILGDSVDPGFMVWAPPVRRFHERNRIDALSPER